MFSNLQLSHLKMGWKNLKETYNLTTNKHHAHCSVWENKPRFDFYIKTKPKIFGFKI